MVLPPQDPKSCASANSATAAFIVSQSLMESVPPAPLLLGRIGDQIPPEPPMIMLKEVSQVKQPDPCGTDPRGIEFLAVEKLFDSASCASYYDNSESIQVLINPNLPT